MTPQKRSGIILSFTLPGFHNYPDAPQAVSFLAQPHRHLFHFKVHFSVTHHNRDLEFFITSAEVKEFITGIFGSPCRFGARSCEMIAKVVLTKFMKRGCFRVEVWEDDENGGFVEL